MSFGIFDTLCYQTVGVQIANHNWNGQSRAGMAKSNQCNALRSWQFLVSTAILLPSP